VVTAVTQMFKVPEFVKMQMEGILSLAALSKNTTEFSKSSCCIATLTT